MAVQCQTAYSNFEGRPLDGSDTDINRVRLTQAIITFSLVRHSGMRALVQ